MVVLQILGTSCWYRDNCITKLWSQSSYFLYLYMVFFQHCFHSEQHLFHLDRQFLCYPKNPNWLSRVLNSIQSSHIELLFHRLPCTLSFSFEGLMIINVIDIREILCSIHEVTGMDSLPNFCGKVSIQSIIWVIKFMFRHIYV